MANPDRAKDIYRVVTIRDTNTGVVVSERWLKDGKNHREDGPALIARDPRTGTVVHEMWLQYGQCHRLDGPAIVFRHAVTGRIYFSQWYLNNKKIKAPRRPRTRTPCKHLLTVPEGAD